MKHKNIAFLSLILTAVLLSVCWTFSTKASAAASSNELFSARDLSGSYDDEIATISLNGTEASSDSDHVSISGSVVTIQDAGTYILTGTLENGSILVDADREDKIQLVLSGNSCFDCDGTAVYNGGTIIINGQQVDSIPVQMMGGRDGRMGGMMGGMPGGHGGIKNW